VEKSYKKILEGVTPCKATIYRIVAKFCAREVALYKNYKIKELTEYKLDDIAAGLLASPTSLSLMATQCPGPRNIFNVQCQKAYLMCNVKKHIQCAMPKSIFSVQCQKAYAMCNAKRHARCPSKSVKVPTLNNDGFAQCILLKRYSVL
jgi:hypothetical protein